ncbi:MAG: nucleoside-diphosphate kinase [Verrucomicrobiia bacterium]
MAMREELAYALVTPYSLRKSRTGGIISRLISRTGLDLVAGKIFAPTEDLAGAFSAGLVRHGNPRHRRTQELIRDYVLDHLMPDITGRRSRCLLLLFRGENAIIRLREVIGTIVTERTSGETVRDTYGDYILDSKGKVRHFEPAVLAGQDPDEVREHLLLWVAHSEMESGNLGGVVEFPPHSNVERTLVLLKPENFRFPNSRPGGIIDLFSRTGLFIVAFKVLHMSVSQAEEFYRPALAMLETVYRETIGSRAAEILERELGIVPLRGLEKDLGAMLGPLAARRRWEEIVAYMSGRSSSECDSVERSRPGTQKSIALVYEGVDAVHKIRSILGPTDPQNAPPGSIRKEFGQTIMANSAHASDSVANAEREMRIIDVWENNLKAEVEKFYGNT